MTFHEEERERREVLGTEKKEERKKERKRKPFKAQYANYPKEKITHTRDY